MSLPPFLEPGESSPGFLSEASPIATAGELLPPALTDPTTAGVLEAHYRTLVELIQGFIVVAPVDGSKPQAYASPRMESMLGFTAAQWIDNAGLWLQQLLPEDRERYTAEVAELCATGQPLSSVYRIHTREGRLVWLQCEAKIVRHADGRPWFLSGVGFDVTQLKNTESANQNLEAARLSAETANRRKSEFLAHASHEIRTPMSGILGIANLLRDTPLSDEQRQYLSMISESADSLLKVVNNILDISKIEAGKLDLESEPFSPRELLRNATSVLMPHASEAGIELKYRSGPDVPDVVRGDCGRLRQIILNLAGNAIKFTTAGTVEIAVQLPPAQTAENSDIDLGMLLFSVSDTGMGIPADKLNLIFEPFRQADHSIQRAFGGTGLGLTISARLVEMMGGRIWVESEPGAGSTFWFTARFTAEPAQDGTPLNTSMAALQELSLPAPAANMAGAEPAPLHVLLVEDTLINQKLAQRLIEKDGHTVTAASNGKEALEILAQQTFDVIVMDVQMPVMDGIETTAAIRAAERLSGRHIPIIAMTAHALKGDNERLLAAGMDAYVSKPFHAGDLLKLVRELPERLATTPKAPNNQATGDARRS